MEKWTWVFALLFSGLLSCSEKEDIQSSRGSIEIYLTDAPAAFDEVNIDLRNVLINFTDSENSGWQSLDEVEAGQIDLLSLSGGIEKFLGSSAIESEKITGVMLVLGNDNYLVKEGMEYPLFAPGAQQSGLKIMLNKPTTISQDYEYILDFDAMASIQYDQQNDQFKLIPVLRAFERGSGGSLSGTILQKDVFTNVSIIKGADTINTITNSDGYFFMGGLAAGNYVLSVSPDRKYQKLMLDDINIVAGNNTGLGVISLSEKPNTGTVAGKIVPASVSATISLATDLDTINTINGQNGDFLFEQIEPGIYDLLITPELNSNYENKIISEVEVIAGDTTDLGVIQINKLSSTGKLIGKVVPASVDTRVAAILDSDTTFTTTQNNGDFYFERLEEGSYTLWFDPIEPTDYLEEFLYDVKVNEGKSTDIGNIKLSKK